ncbi:MAG: diaminobutyrate acetyltransferase [Dehalococcoidales bacterium]|nr:diaminobutyrate acetyltransferase [Dehalococcoidales bacterium]
MITPRLSALVMKDETKLDFSIRNTVKSDGPAVYLIAEKCPPLDLNSRYCYLLLCTQFDKYCLVAEEDNKIIGFVSAYPHPHHTDTLFVWQIGVDPDFHGHGIGTALLEHLIPLAIKNGLIYLETTITLSNKASRALFRKITEAYNTNCIESDYFPVSLLGGEHKEEKLLRMGPFKEKGDL